MSIMKRSRSTIAPFIVSIIILMAFIPKVMAQQEERKFRIAKIEVDSNFLEQYKTALSEAGINHRIDEAYKRKYGKSPYMAHMVGKSASSATVKIIPSES